MAALQQSSRDVDSIPPQAKAFFKIHFDSRWKLKSTNS